MSLGLALDGLAVDAQHAVLGVDDSALLKGANAPMSTEGYEMGQAPGDGTDALGWSLGALREAGYDRAQINVTASGPEGSQVLVYRRDPNGKATAVLHGGSFNIADADTEAYSILPLGEQTEGTLSWMFTAPGEYSLNMTITAWSSTTDAVVQSPATLALRVAVGSEAIANALAPAGVPASNTPSQPATAQQQSAPASNATASPSAQGDGRTSGQSDARGAARASSSGEKCVATTITREATAEEQASLTSNQASPNTARTTLTFSVGPGASGNATEGHFDLGPAIENGQLVARVKDDRSAPAQWVDPASLTFALGDAARITAPDETSFVATPGSQVWLISSTQVPGVPWLGMNSQRDEIVNGTTGGVNFTLDSVDGPGRVAVFNSGSLGGGVGEHVFDGAGSTYTLPPNTHAHQNWLFTEPGTYTLTLSMRVTPTGADLAGTGGGTTTRLTPTGATGANGRPVVSEVVGRTASGDECDLTLATTGADAQRILLLATALVFSGCVAVGASRRRGAQDRVGNRSAH
ncbi:putative ABC transporter-associated repeat protein [Actinomyces sp. oral taxon 877 str. F0543]|nr:putative ABC transporter-associated repeat protein [Actinomyces sp. oral taxon 877 str. F0543]